MKKMGRLLAGVLSALLIVTSISPATFANELNSETEAFLEDSSVMGETEHSDDYTESETVSDEPISEEFFSTFESDSSEEESETLELMEESEESLSLEGLETVSGNAVVGDYSKSFDTEKAVALYVKDILRERIETCRFNTTFKVTTDDAFRILDMAYSEELADNPREGAYLRANIKRRTPSLATGTYITGTNWEVTFTYFASAEEEKKVTKKVNEIVNTLGLKNTGKSEYEKVKAINDYLINNVESVSAEGTNYNGTYAALIGGKSTCQGFASSFYRLCREAGIDCRYVTSNLIHHAWNMVKVSGKWYNIDVAFNDGGEGYEYKYFLLNDIDFLGHPRDEQYLGEFVSEYPVAELSYGRSQKLLNVANLNYNLKDSKGNLYSTSVDQTTKRPKFIIFYEVSSGSISSDELNKRTAKTIQAFADADVVRACADVYIANISNTSSTAISSVISNTDIKSVSAQGISNKELALQYLNAATGSSILRKKPVVVMIDGNNVVRIVSEGCLIEDDLTRICMPNLTDNWNPDVVLLEGISLNYSELSLRKSSSITDTAKLEVSFYPENCLEEKKVSYASSNDKVAKVDENGLVTAIDSGTAVITASCAGKTAKCTVTVTRLVDSIKLTDKTGTDVTNKNLNIHAGESLELNMVSTPQNVLTGGEIKWTVSDSTAVKLEKNETGYSVTANSADDISSQKTVTIQVEVDGLKAECRLTLIPSYVTLNANGGKIDGKDSFALPVVPGKTFGELPVPDAREGYVFVGWKTSADENAGFYVAADTPVNNHWELFAIWKQLETEKIWVRELGSYTYTGAAIKPSVKVYDGKLQLTEGVDYTLVYKNNKAVYQYREGDAEFNASKAPSVLVKGKNNYADSITVYFTIEPKAIDDSDVTISTDLLVKTETGKTQYLIPTIKWGKTLLKNNTDFTLEYPDSADSGAYKLPGLYRITIHGKGNYSGERTVNMRITGKNAISIKKATVKNLMNYNFTGEEIVQNTEGDKPFALYYSNKRLTEGKDYYTEYSNNREIGTATITVTGIGRFTGVRKLTFKITGRNIAKAVINKDALQSVKYTGSAITPDVALTYTVDKHTNYTLEQSKDDGITGDYIVCYENNTAAGNAKIIIKGINGYTGTLTKVFKITPYEWAGFENSRVRIEYAAESAYVKGGTKPSVKVYFNISKTGNTNDWQLLTEGSDYVLKYANTNKVFTLGPGDEGFYNRAGKTAAPTITIVGKKNYKGSLKAYYKITSASLKQQASISARDVYYSAKAGKWATGITVTDINGKKLAAKTDYDSNIVYKYAAQATMTDGSTRSAGQTVEKNDSPMPGTTIHVIVRGKGNYSSSDADCLQTVLPYKIIATNKDIGKGIIFVISDKIHPGSSINSDKGVVISKEDISFTTDRNHTDFTMNDFEIVEGSYSNNRLTGYASVTLRGINGYGGTKVVKFRIKAKSIF